MSIGGTEKEFIFHLYLKTRKERLEQALGVRLTDIRLEQVLEDIIPCPQLMREERGGKKKPVDMYAVDTNLSIPVLVESVLGQSNEAHQEKVRRLIRCLNAGRVVYQALSFQEKHVTELRDMVVMSGKPVQLDFAEINPDVLPPIQHLDRLNKLDVLGNIDLVDSIQTPVQVVERVEHPLFRLIQPQPTPRLVHDLSCRKGMNQFLLEELRKNIPQFLPFHRQKTLYEQNPVIYFGAGANGLTYHCSIRDRRNRAFVELRFSEDMSYLYRLFTIKPDLLQRVDDRIRWGNNRIGCYFRSSDDIRCTVSELVTVFGRMIHELSRPLYGLLDFEYEVKAMLKTRTA